MANVRALDRVQPVGLTVVEFGQDDFKSRESEQSLRICSARKDDCPEAVRFWAAALRTGDCSYREEHFLPYAEAGHCEVLSRSEFDDRVRSCTGSLANPVPDFSHALDGYVTAMAMYSDWDDIGLLADLGDVWAAVFWETTA